MRSFSVYVAARVAGLCMAQAVAVVGHAQGSVIFANVGANVYAPVSYLDGRTVGPEFRAALYAGPAGAPVAELRPVGPIATFVEGGYVFAGDVTLPGHPTEEPATFVLRAFNGDSWETSTCRGESNPVTSYLSIGSEPPRELIGLQPFTVDCIPEPGVVVLAGLGAGVLWVAGRRGRQAQFG